MSDRTSLHDWIATATAGLPPSAVEKFSAEIADHAAESRRKHIAEGMPPDEADRAALAALGDAAQVARTFRDAHFSRTEYTRGGAVVLALLVISLVGMLLGILSDTATPASELNLFRQWVWKWDFVAAAANCILLIFAARAMLTLFKEQYEIRVPRWGWRLAAACLLAVLPSGLLIPALVWAINFSPFSGEAAYSAPVSFAFGILPALQLLHIAAYLVMGALALGFCIWRLAAVRYRARSVLAMLVILSGLIGVGLLVAGGTMLATILAPLPYPQNVPGILFVNALSSLLNLLYLALLAMLLRLFWHMRRPGAVVTG